VEESDLKTLPTQITVDAAPGSISFTPNELRLLKAATGRTMTDLMGENGEDADKMQAVVWIELRRRGHSPSWEDAGDVAIAFEAPVSDPSQIATSTASPPSATSGE